MKETPFSRETILAFFNGALHPEQHEQVVKWLSRQDPNFVDLFLDEHLETNTYPASGNMQPDPNGFENLKTKIIYRKTRIRQLVKWGTGIAACLCLSIFLLIPAKQQSQNSMAENTENTERPVEFANLSPVQKKYVLPDSSSVMLSPNSALSFRLVNRQRMVELKGKAFFDVRHMEKKSFIVRTAKLRTVVLGTSFWVDASNRNGKIIIKVNTGKVGVIQEEKPPIFLLPEEKAIFQRETGLVKQNPQKPAQRNITRAKLQVTALAFNNTPISTVLKAIEETYNISLSSDSTLRGDIQPMITLNTKDKTISEILMEIRKQSKLNYEIKPGKIKKERP